MEGAAAAFLTEDLNEAPQSGQAKARIKKENAVFFMSEVYKMGRPAAAGNDPPPPISIEYQE